MSASQEQSADIWELSVYGYLRSHINIDIFLPDELKQIIVQFYRTFIKSNILTDIEKAKLYDMVCDELAQQKINWDLIYRATEDEFDYKSFWNKCNGVSNVIVIVESTTNNVFGGYTSKAHTERTTSTKDENAFIYSIRSSAGYKSKIFPILKDQIKFAIHTSYTHLCCFGEYGCDLYMQQNCNKPGTNTGAQQRSYDIPLSNRKYLVGGPKATLSFTVNDIEMFQLNNS